MDEHGRPPPGGQRSLPLEAIEASDEAYLAAVTELRDCCGFGSAVTELLRWAIREGRRERGRIGVLIAPKRTQRDLARSLGFSASTIADGLAKLRAARLLFQTADGYELALPWLVEMAEEASSQRQMALDLSPADALSALGGARTVRRRSVALGGARSRSAQRPIRENANINPESESEMDIPIRNTVSDSGAPSTAERRRAPPNTPSSLASHPAWARLQTRHFRPIELAAFRPAFYAAVEAGLIDGTEECKIRFLATVYDLANDCTIRQPAAVLRSRVERKTCYRISDEGNRWAKQQMRPVEHRRQ